MDGYQVLEHLQAQGDMPSLPVLVLSSWAEDKSERVERLGAAEFLTKPFSGAVLLDVSSACSPALGRLASEELYNASENSPGCRRQSGHG